VPGTNPQVLPLSTAISRLTTDHVMLLSRVETLPETELAAPFQLESGPLGDFCESLHDLIAHVLMWDEINLVVLTEATAGRRHWSLDPRWETPDAGRRLNLAGVQAGRHLPASLLLHRLRTVWDAVLAEFARHDEDAWTGSTAHRGESPGELAQRVWTVPGHDAFWHAAIHLDQLPNDRAEA
jgi:hypothetical protein